MFHDDIESKIHDLNENIATIEHCGELKPYQTVRSKRIADDLKYKLVRAKITKNMHAHMLKTQRKLNFMDKAGASTINVKLNAKLQPKDKGLLEPRNSQIFDFKVTDESSVECGETPPENLPDFDKKVAIYENNYTQESIFDATDAREPIRIIKRRQQTVFKQDRAKIQTQVCLGSLSTQNVSSE